MKNMEQLHRDVKHPMKYVCRDDIEFSDHVYNVQFNILLMFFFPLDVDANNSICFLFVCLFVFFFLQNSYIPTHALKFITHSFFVLLLI